MATADRLIEVFNEAKVRLTEAERQRFVAEACADDAELKHQVLSLLQAHDGAVNFLQPAPFASTVLITEKPGDRIGRYKLLEQIGEGGCGVVYMAEQEEPVRRRVALKVIKLGMDTKQVIARFEAERQALALMDHPNIAKVHDGGATETGRPFFVMELVRGIKITEYCDQNNLSTNQRLELFIQVCQAIQHAHQKGIIHRDIKPSNILVTQHDDVAVPKVIDFGIAKATTGQLTDKTLFTAFAQFIGTPAYMSPEQAQLSGLDIDTRADIYSLGVLLYELLTGNTPFDAKELMAAGMDEMRRKIREDEPARPSTCLSTMTAIDLTTVAKHRHAEPPRLIHLIRGDLDWLVMKCLEKDRTRRYETANALAMDLQRHLNDEPVVACPPSRSYRFQKLVRRNKLAFAAGIAIAASLVVGFSTATWMYFREADSRKRATKAEELAMQRLAEVSAERDAKEVARKEAEVISLFLGEVFRSSDLAGDSSTLTVPEALNAAVRKLETDLVDEPARRAKLQATAGGIHFALGLYKEAVPLREKALTYYKTASGPEHPDTLTAMQALAISYAAAGRSDEALRLRETTLTLRRKVLGPEHPATLWAMQNLADSYSDTRRREEALQLREQLLALRRKVLGGQHRDTILAMASTAASYAAAGREAEALKLREEVLLLRRATIGPEHPDTLWIMHTLADSYQGAGRWNEALKLREEVVALRRKVLGPGNAATLAAMKNLGESYRHAGRHHEAIKLLEEVFAARRKVSGPEHQETLWIAERLAAAYLEGGQLADAIPLLAEALARKPENTHMAMKVAALQVWFGKNAEHAATCRSMLNWATKTSDHQAVERIAKIACLRPIGDASMREAVLSLARRSIELGQEKADLLPFAQMTLGMAEYRNDHYRAADEALRVATTTASKTGHYRQFVEITGSFYQAMSLAKQGNRTGAREAFAAAEVRMKPWPADESNPLADPACNHDDLILWLAYKEARALLNIPSSGQR